MKQNGKQDRATGRLKPSTHQGRIVLRLVEELLNGDSTVVVLRRVGRSSLLEQVSDTRIDPEPSWKKKVSSPVPRDQAGG